MTPDPTGRESRTSENQLVRVPSEELWYHAAEGRYYYSDAPFTGLCFKQNNLGKLVSEEQFHNGLPQGLTTTWFSSGQMASQAMCQGGIFNGLRRTWYESGQLASEELYELGICLQRSKWDEQGTILEAYELLPSDPIYETLEFYRSLRTSTPDAQDRRGQ